MTTTVGFDVYGTLIDTQGVISELESLLGDKAFQFSQTWREKQLEYSFRRGLMACYENFGVCTSQALDYSCRYYDVALSAEQKSGLLTRYSTLPVFADVVDTLTPLKSSGFRLYAFSNGSRSAVEQLLTNAGIREFFLGVVSCDDIQTFKPNPAVYAHFLQQSNASQDSAWLISSNSFELSKTFS